MISLNLFHEMENLQREMGTIFGGIAREPNERTVLMPRNVNRRYPQINLSEDADNIYLAALIPGVESKSFEISLTGSTLTLGGERHVDEPDGADWQRQERARGKFMRTIELPLDIDSTKVEAEYVDGVLRITLPKAEASKPKRISIKTGK